MRRTFAYAAMTNDECNAADGYFWTVSRRKILAKNTRIVDNVRALLIALFLYKEGENMRINIYLYDKSGKNDLNF